MRIAARYLVALLLASGAASIGPIRSVAAGRASAAPRSSATRQAAEPRGETTTELPDGRTLVAGGEVNGAAIATARLIDPATGTVTQISLPAPRAHHTATVLADGTVLIAGGVGAGGQVVSTLDVFDPVTAAFTPITIQGSTARAGASATLLTDGRVLIVGGQDESGRALGAEIWDLTLNAATALASADVTPRIDHTATLLPDGRVLITGGRDASGQPRTDADIVDPATGQFIATPLPPSSDPTAPALAASAPTDGALDVPTDVRIALRFSKALAIPAVARSIVLSTQDGLVPVTVVPAEGGRLAFVTPGAVLAAGTTYTLSIDGAADAKGAAVAATAITFTTHGDAPKPNPVDTEPWLPDSAAAKNGWRTDRPDSPWRTLPPLTAPPGVTAVSGQVLRLDGKPLAHVTLSVGGQQTRTDGTGRFLLLLPSMASGHAELGIDGRTANRPRATYGTFEYGLQLVGGRTTVLPFTIWMPLLDTAHQVTIASPTLSEVVITTPYIPGLELHLPSGTVIKDDEGQVVHTVSITPIPVDRTPFPLPNNSDVPVYFTIQPGGAYVVGAGYGSGASPTAGAWLVYPNYRHEFPGKRIQFYHYDPKVLGWYVYGLGTVTPNGAQVTPDPTTRIRAFTGAMINSGASPPAQADAPNCCPIKNSAGDPVGLATGLFNLEQTDLALPDTLPIAVTRTYRSRDVEVRPFGPGTTLPYAMFLWSAQQSTYAEADLVLPDGAKIHYVRTSPGTSFFDAIFQHVETATTSATPTAFYKSTMVWNGNGWDLTLLDGTVYVFGENAPLQAIRDRYGNTITIAHSVGQTGHITQVTSPHGRWIAFTYGEDANCSACISHITDNIGRTVHYAYDAGGNLSTVTDPLGHTTQYTYDSYHNMLTVKNRNGVVYVTNEYTTAADAPTPVGWVKTQTHADNGVYHFAYTVSNGQSTSTDVSDPRGYVERVTFNTDGYTLSDTRALGQPEAQTTTVDRPSTNNFVASVEDAVGAFTVYAHDSFGNITAVTRCKVGQSPCTGANPGALTSSYTYDPRFQQVATVTDPLLHTTTYAYDDVGNLASVTDALNHQTAFAYDAAGQQTAMTDALQHTSRFEYRGGDRVTATDAMGRVTTRFLDAAGRSLGLTDSIGQTTRFAYDGNDGLQTVTNALGGNTSFAYLPDGQLQSVTDANQHTTAYTYDLMGRIEQRTDPLQRTESFTFDLNGNPESRTDRRSELSTYAYDSLDRVHQITYADGSTLTYTYDARNRPLQIDDSLSGSPITRTYDDFDRITSEISPQGSITYSYDDAGRRLSMSVSGQDAVAYTYDAANRLTGITQGSASAAFTYDDANRLLTLTLPAAVVAGYEYDDANQVIGITYGTGTTLLGDLTYDYDGAGRRTQLGGGWARTSLPQVLASASYDAADELVSQGSQSLQYDRDGNLASDGLTSFLWDARGRLTNITGQTSATYAYDATDRRVSATIGNSQRTYLYDGENIATLTTGGATTAFMASRGLDSWIAEIDQQGPQTILTDALGSVVALTDSAATLQRQYAYEPYGLSHAVGVLSDDLGFTGREQDAFDLYYYRARYYDASAGRFLSEDPIRSRNPVSVMSLYGYVDDGPIDATDPLGLQRMPPLTYPPPTPTGCTKVGMTYVCNPPPGPVMCPVKEKGCTPYVNRSLYYDCLMIRLAAPSMTYPSPNGWWGAAVMTGFECADNATRCVETGMPPPWASSGPDPQGWHQATKPPQWGARPPWR